MSVYTDWHDATSKLPPGVQRVFINTLEMVRDEKIRLAWGKDYNQNGAPCLVNAAANMLSVINGEGGNGKPIAYFNEVVSLFDAINRELYEKNINKKFEVSSLSASILLHHFGIVKELTLEDHVSDAMGLTAFEHGVYTEPSDADIARDWFNSLEVDPSCEVNIETFVDTENGNVHHHVDVAGYSNPS